MRPSPGDRVVVGAEFSFLEIVGQRGTIVSCDDDFGMAMVRWDKGGEENLIWSDRIDLLSAIDQLADIVSEG